MKRILLSWILISLCATTSWAQNFTHQESDFDLQLVSVDGDYNTRTAIVTVKVKQKNNGTNVYIDPVAADNNGNIYYCEKKFYESQSCNVSEGIYVKTTLDQVPLTLPNCDTILPTLKLRRNIVFRNVPVHWSSSFKPLKIKESAEELWDVEGTTKIEPVPLDLYNNLVCDESEEIKDSAYVLAAVGNKIDHRLFICFQSCLHDKYFRTGYEMGMQSLGIIYSENGMIGYRKGSHAAPCNQWDLNTLTFVVPEYIDTIKDVNIGLCMGVGDFCTYHKIIQAKNVPVQWLDIPVEYIQPQDLIKMIGKNCVGSLKLGTTLEKIPQKIEGMYNEYEIDDSEDDRRNGFNGPVLYFYSDGFVVMKGYTTTAGYGKPILLKRLVIDDGIVRKYVDLEE